MIDFEIVGDLLRRSDIPHKTTIEDLPVIRVVERGQPTLDSKAVVFVFDRQGKLKTIVTER